MLDWASENQSPKQGFDAMVYQGRALQGTPVETCEKQNRKGKGIWQKCDLGKRRW